MFRFCFFFLMELVIPLENTRRNKSVRYRNGDVTFGVENSAVLGEAFLSLLSAFPFPCSLGKKSGLNIAFLQKIVLSWGTFHRI